MDPKSIWVEGGGISSLYYFLVYPHASNPPLWNSESQIKLNAVEWIEVMASIKGRLFLFYFDEFVSVETETNKYEKTVKLATFEFRN